MKITLWQDYTLNKCFCKFNVQLSRNALLLTSGFAPTTIDTEKVNSKAKIGINRGEDV